MHILKGKIRYHIKVNCSSIFLVYQQFSLYSVVQYCINILVKIYIWINNNTLNTVYTVSSINTSLYVPITHRPTSKLVRFLNFDYL